jgi:DNA-binding MarR family transcriptional regulator
MSLNRPEPPAMGPVASLLAMDRTTLTAALKPLERRGLVHVYPDPSDRRSRILVLTDQGRELLAGALPIWKSTHESLEKDAPDLDFDKLRKDLRAVS